MISLSSFSRYAFFVGLLLINLFNSKQTHAQSLIKAWDESFGGSGSDVLLASLPTVDGGLLLGGTSNSDSSATKTQTSRGEDDYWIIKTNAQGQIQWNYAYGGANEDVLTSLQPTADGGYLVGGYSRSASTGDKTQGNKGFFGTADYWIIKLDVNGNKQWDRTYGSNNQDLLATALPTTDGGYILGGTSDSGINIDKSQISRGSVDYWIIKIDAAGTKQWDKTIGGTGYDNLQDVQLTKDGGYLLSGYSNSPNNGDKTQPSRGEIDYWVVKLDATGIKQWDKTLGGRGIDHLSTAKACNDGSYLLGGYSESAVTGDKTQANKSIQDYWIVKLTADGTKQWDKTFGGNTNSSCYLMNIQLSSNGGYLLGGFSDSQVAADKTQPSLGYYDYWVLKLDAAGIREWDYTLGGDDNDFLTCVHPTIDGGFLLTGDSRSGKHGDKSHTNQGGNDIWVAKLVGYTTSNTRPTIHHPLSIYPNPAHTQIHLKVGQGTLYGNLEVTLLDISGRHVFTKSVTFLEGKDLSIELGTISPGLYILQVTDSNNHTEICSVRIQE